jgi:hypothetical protein
VPGHRGHSTINFYPPPPDKPRYLRSAELFGFNNSISGKALPTFGGLFSAAPIAAAINSTNNFKYILTFFGIAF